MSFNLAGFGLALIALALVGVELVVNRYIKKVTNTYWFWLSIGIVYLIYCICITWVYHWKSLAVVDIPWGSQLTNEQSYLVSYAFLLNICPFVNFAFCATLIADPTRKAARCVAPLAIVGSFIVLFIDIVTHSGATFSWRYIFIGQWDRPTLHYSGHLINLLIAIGVLMNTPKFGWKGTVAQFGFIIGFYLYVTIVAYTTGCQVYVSGVVLRDFVDGQYAFFNMIFPNMPYLSMPIFFIGLAGVLLGICILSDVCKRGWFAYGDKQGSVWWKSYDYQKTMIKEPWGYFSHQWQARKKSLN